MPPPPNRNSFSVTATAAAQHLVMSRRLKVTSLADVLTMVPDLYPLCLGQDKLASMKKLRLVCKDVCGMAQSTALSFCLHPGDNPRPSPQQVVRLLQGALLKKLTVNVTVVSGGLVVVIYVNLEDACISCIAYCRSYDG